MELKIHEQIALLLDQHYDGNQSSLARKIGVSPQAVQKWISGAAYPKLETIIKISELHGISVHSLLFGASGTERSQRKKSGDTVVKKLTEKIKSLPKDKQRALLCLISTHQDSK